MKKHKRASQQSPKNKFQPRRRSSRLSPQTDNKEQAASKVAEECVLKPRCVNTANWQFTHQSKDFKVPAKNAASKLRRTSNENTKSKDGSFKPAQVLCPLRHGPKDVCTICMARYVFCVSHHKLSLFFFFQKILIAISFLPSSTLLIATNLFSFGSERSGAPLRQHP